MWVIEGDTRSLDYTSFVHSLSWPSTQPAQNPISRDFSHSKLDRSDSLEVLGEGPLPVPILIWKCLK